MFKTIHRFIHGIAWLMAVVGGFVLGALVLMMCLSILGREASDLLHSEWMQTTMPGLASWLLDIGVGPVFGDYEFVVAGLAFSVFCFLGWCHITGGHATVDVFTSGLSDRKRRWLQMVIDIVFAAALVLIAIQLNEGMTTLMRRRSTTFLLQYPLWWNYAAALVPAVLSALIGIYTAIIRVAEALSDRTIIVSQGADH